MSDPQNHLGKGKSTTEDTIFDDTSSGNKSSKNFKVCVRVRPLIQREIDIRDESCVEIHSILNSIAIYKPTLINPERSGPIQTLVSSYEGDVATTEHKFSFDKTFSSEIAQAELYSCSIRPVVLNILEGYNGTIIAYGQTSAGKTYTMEGNDESDGRGIIPRAAEDIFSYIEKSSNAASRFLVRASFLQIYNEVLQDLLEPKSVQSNQTKKETLKIREYPQGIQVQGLLEEVVRSPNDIVSLMKRGSYQRTTAGTKLNPFSSRSHAIFTIIVEHAEISMVTKKQMITIGKLNMVDLAGSERVKESGAEGKQFEEACKINSSLSTLGKVILSLTSPGIRSHVPYRDSKVTLLLRDSLGGNCRTTLITNITPASNNYSESLGTLRFAHTAKSVKNDAKVNQDMSEQGLLLAYEKELKRLKAELAKAAGAELSSSQGSAKLRQLKDQLEGANIEKKAIQDELFARDNEINESRLQQENLTNKIDYLEKQLLIGGQVAPNTCVRETEEFKVAIGEVEQQMKGKVDELENENETLKKEKEALQRRENDLISKLKNLNLQPGGSELNVSQSQVSQVEEIQKYLFAMCHPQTGIELLGTDITTGFTGYSACKWILSNITGIDSFEKAVHIGQQLIEFGAFLSYPEQPYFTDNDTDIFYFELGYLNDFSQSRSFSFQGAPISPSYRPISNSARYVPTPMDGRASSAFSDAVLRNSSRDLGPREASHAYSAMSMAPDVLSDSLGGQGGITALHSAAYKGDKVLVKQLVPNHGVDCRDLQGRTPLIFAVMGKRAKCVEMLLRLGANVHAVDNHGRNSLLWAAYYGHFDIIRSLIKIDKSIVDFIDPEGRTALHWGTKPEYPHGLRIITKYCKPDLILVKDKDNSTPLIWAVLCGHPDHLSLLLKQCPKADPKICDLQGHNALHYAVNTGQEHCCDILLRHCQEVAICPDYSGRLPAHLAITEKGSLEILHKIISLAGPIFCGINTSDKRQATPLHWASALNRADMVKLLIEAGADLNARDIRGFSPLHYALQKNYTDIIQILEEGNPNSS